MALSRPPSSVVPRSFPVRVPPCCASLRLQGCALQAQRRATSALPRPLPRRLRRLPPPLRSLRSLPVGGLPPCCPPPLAAAFCSLTPCFASYAPLRRQADASAGLRHPLAVRRGGAEAKHFVRQQKRRPRFVGQHPPTPPCPLPRRRCLRFASASPPAPSPSVATLPSRRGLPIGLPDSSCLVGGITHAPLPTAFPCGVFHSFVALGLHSASWPHWPTTSDVPLHPCASLRSAACKPHFTNLLLNIILGFRSRFLTKPTN